MKFELKEYQEEAASRVISGLRKGSAEYAEDGEHTAVSLSAPTGAGKTVIAASVIERLLFGDPEGDFAGDPDAVILWLTDDPSLNEQTRKKLLEASERLGPAHLVTLDEAFDAPTFPRGKVYFLNIQKLSKTSKLVVKREGRRTYPLWQTISNTIRDHGVHYYLVIDEAHRGTGTRTKEDQTIASRLMNGEPGVVTAAPVVLGISATPERFERAVEAGAQVRLLRRVPVPVALVRESGLIKDVLSISYRGETQVMDTTLVRQAAANLRQMDEAWNAYTESESEPPVRPVMVIQIPASVSEDRVSEILDVCVDEWEVLGQRHAIAHSLESHVAMSFGKHIVNYVAPQNIQEHPSIRVVLFKQALTTGWDCPRAEVMLSLQNAEDPTYIAQLIGRMVRSPLARRIESEETLNRVRLYLPGFNAAAVAKVKEGLERDDGGLPTDIEVNAVDALRNPKVLALCFAVVEALPSYQVPGPVHRSQVARLHKLAALLVGDGLLSDAIQVADDFLIGVLEGERGRLAADGSLAALVSDAETASVEIMNILRDGTTVIEREDLATDIADVDRLFATAKRKFRDGLADKYWGWRVMHEEDDPFDAKVLAVALSQDSATVEKVEREAADRVRQWLDTHGDAIATLSEDKKAKYAEVRAMAREPEQVNPGLPMGAISMPGDASVPQYEKHLYSDKAGNFRARLGGWEEYALKVEASRPGFVGWYRNPTGGQRALRIPYVTGGAYGKLYPDFVVLHTDEGGQIKASIVDPHGHHLADSGDKLRGLAAYADKHGDAYARIIGVIKDAAGEFRFIDLKDATVRAALRNANTKDEIEKVYTDCGSAY